jgi:hypothetical protein
MQSLSPLCRGSADFCAACRIASAFQIAPMRQRLFSVLSHQFIPRFFDAVHSMGTNCSGKCNPSDLINYPENKMTKIVTLPRPATIGSYLLLFLFRDIIMSYGQFEGASDHSASHRRTDPMSPTLGRVPSNASAPPDFEPARRTILDSPTLPPPPSLPSPHCQQRNVLFRGAPSPRPAYRVAPRTAETVPWGTYRHNNPQPGVIPETFS